MGTDYPFDMGEVDPVGRIEGLPGLSDEDRRGMLGLNAARLLGLPDDI
jgi:aminocarboxymuconate-semialdehyde decarboxylase